MSNGANLVKKIGNDASFMHFFLGKNYVATEVSPLQL